MKLIFAEGAGKFGEFRELDVRTTVGELKSIERVMRQHNEAEQRAGRGTVNADEAVLSGLWEIFDVLDAAARTRWP